MVRGSQPLVPRAREMCRHIQALFVLPLESLLTVITLALVHAHNKHALVSASSFPTGDLTADDGHLSTSE